MSRTDSVCSFLIPAIVGGSFVSLCRLGALVLNGGFKEGMDGAWDPIGGRGIMGGGA